MQSKQPVMSQDVGYAILIGEGWQGGSSAVVGTRYWRVQIKISGRQNGAKKTFCPLLFRGQIFIRARGKRLEEMPPQHLPRYGSGWINQTDAPVKLRLAIDVKILM